MNTDGDELVDLFLWRQPEVDWHVGSDRRIVVEASGDEGQEYTNALIRSDRNFQELFKNTDLLGPVGILVYCEMSS